MNTKLKDKVAVVTGAGGTLCSVIARDLSRQGMKVALLGRTLPKLESLRKNIEAAGGEAHAYCVDVTAISALTKVAGEINETLGPCSVLINGAGGKLPGGTMSLTEYTPSELAESSEMSIGFFNCDLNIFRDEVNLNLCSIAFTSQLFGKQIARSGGGSIINFASMASYRALSRIAPYAAAKAGVAAFTEWLAAYLAPSKIRVNAVAPGFFLNENNKKLLYNQDGSLTERGNQVLRHTPMRRFGTAEELLGCVNWLIDDDKASFVTGTTIPVDGGFLACPGT